jgi:hypothetical protein
MKRIELTILSLLLAAGIAGWIVSGQRLDGMEAEHEKEMTRLADEITKLQAKTGSASGQAAATAESPSPVSAAPVPSKSPGAIRREAILKAAEFLSAAGMRGNPLGLARLSGGSPGLELPPYAPDAAGQLGPRFGELFGLSPAELVQLQERIDAVREQVAEAIVAHSTMQRPDADTVVIEVRGLGESAAQYRQEFLDVFQETLGEAGYRALALLNRERAADPRVPLQVPRGGLSDLFSNFGAAPHTITVKRQANRIEVSDDSGSSSGQRLTDQMRLRFGPAMQLVPAGF